MPLKLSPEDEKEMDYDLPDNKGVLLLGDCLERMKEIPDGSVDMVLTDIPYGEVNRASNGLRKLDKGVADVETFIVEDALAECLRICSGSFYIFCSTEQVSDIRKFFVSQGLSTRLCIWEKTNPSPMNGQHIWLSSIECCVFAKNKNATFTEHCASAVWRNPCARGKLHPTMKPVALMERLIKASSNEGELVMDFTMGSGSTGVAALNLNRRFIGIEMDEEYFKIAQNRINHAS
jgi:site-specific DNA-methyltransferase (adenine-specific)